MSIARVVSFDDVDPSQLAELVRRVHDEPRPDDVPASEILLLHDPEGARALAILLFDDEEAYRRADAALSAMPADETPGRRTAVARYAVAGRMSA